MKSSCIKSAKEILKTIEYATIATANKDGKPRNSPVAHTFDSELNIYWFPTRTINIRKTYEQIKMFSL